MVNINPNPTLTLTLEFSAGSVKKTLPRLIENRPNEFFKRAGRVLTLVQGWSKTSPSRPLRITGRLVNINPNPTLTLTLEFSAGSAEKNVVEVDRE